MNKYLLGLAALLSLPAAAQKYAVKGTAPEGVNKVYLYNIQARSIADSAMVNAGQFALQGEANGKIFAYVTDKAHYNTQVVLDGDITVDLAADKATGTAENDKLTEWSVKMAPAYGKLRQLTSQYYATMRSGQQMSDSVRTAWEAAFDAAEADYLSQVKTCCTENRSMKFPAAFLHSVASMMDKKDVIQLAEEGNPAYMEVSLMDGVRKQINGWKRCLPGTLFTDLEMADTTGTVRKLSDYVGHGKYVLIDFWASWCGPCRKEMPNVKKVYEQYKDKGFDVVGLSFDNDKKAWTGAIKSLGLPWHHLSDLKGWDCIAGKTYGITGIPATLLVGPDGKIVAGDLRGEELGKKMAELIPEK